ncbi:hypothetical protein STEG23_033349 [Scotinomys teguina]
MLQEIKDGIDVEVGQLITLVLGLGSRRVGVPVSSPVFTIRVSKCLPHLNDSIVLIALISNPPRLHGAIETYMNVKLRRIDLWRLILYQYDYAMNARAARVTVSIQVDIDIDIVAFSQSQKLLTMSRWKSGTSWKSESGDQIKMTAVFCQLKFFLHKEASGRKP